MTTPELLKKATKRPWIAEGAGYRLWTFQGGYLGEIRNAKREPVFNGPASFHSLSGKTPEQAEANAKLIVRAVNSFEAMREALKAFEQTYVENMPHDHRDFAIVQQARAALALAEKEGE